MIMNLFAIIKSSPIHGKGVFAAGDITVGEEITGNYNNDGLVEFICKCDSKKCKITVK